MALPPHQPPAIIRAESQFKAQEEADRKRREAERTAAIRADQIRKASETSQKK